MKVIALALESDFALNIYMAICSAVLLFTPIFVKSVLFNKQPQRIFRKPFYKRAHWALSLMFASVSLGIYIQYIKDNRTEFAINAEKKTFIEIQRAVEAQGYIYNQNTKTLLKAIGDNYKVVTEYKYRNMKGRPLMSSPYLFPTFTDSLFLTGKTAISVSTFNNGTANAFAVSHNSFVLYRLENVQYVKQPHQTATYPTPISPKQGASFILWPDFKSLGHKLSQTDTLYLLSKITYKDESGKSMPAQITCFFYVRSFGLTFQGADDYITDKALKIARANQLF
jgi:hypothetical protein